MRRSLFTSALALIWLLETSALAVPSKPMGDMAKRMTDEAAECIIKQDPELIASWFGTLPASSEEQKVVARRETGFARCFGTNLSRMRSWVPEYDYPALRIGLLRFILKSKIVNLPETSPAGLSRANWFANTSISGWRGRASVIANDLGFCLARTDWPTVRTAVLSVEGSAAEAKALRKLIPMIGGCIPPGAKLRMDLPRVRAILEETAFHAVGGITAAALASASYPSRSPR